GVVGEVNVHRGALRDGGGGADVLRQLIDRTVWAARLHRGGVVQVGSTADGKADGLDYRRLVIGWVDVLELFEILVDVRWEVIGADTRGGLPCEYADRLIRRAGVGKVVNRCNRRH